MKTHTVQSALKSITLKAGLVASLCAAHTMTFAAGGLDAGTTEATNFKTWFFTFLGIVAILYLLYLGLMAWAEKKSWGDFGMGVVHVAVVGSVPVLAAWAWGVFAS